MENVAGDSVTEGLRSLANALSGQPIVPEMRRIPKSSIDLPPIPHENDDERFDVDATEPNDPEVPDDSGGLRTEPRARRVSKPRAPKLLSDLKLTDTNFPLADYMKQKNPPDMMDKYAVVAVWLKEQFQITEVSIDHIFTAFKHLGIESQLPTNIIKPLRNLMYNRKWFEKGKAPATFTINWVGESEVGKMGGVSK